jgi:hypothetical protein
MSDMMALKIAIDLLLVPSQARFLRSEPLPNDVVMLLRIAAGDDEAESAGVASTGRSRDVIRRAATFFIEQILFFPHADSYRVLGASPQASAAELRRNVALLLRWLHPDLDSSGERSIFVGRVTAAWNDLKTADRRTAYDEATRKLRSGKGSPSRTGRAAARGRSLATNENRRDRRSIRRQNKRGFWRQALSILLHPYQY